MYSCIFKNVVLLLIEKLNRRSFSMGTLNPSENNVN